MLHLVIMKRVRNSDGNMYKNIPVCMLPVCSINTTQIYCNMHVTMTHIYVGIYRPADFRAKVNVNTLIEIMQKIPTLTGIVDTNLDSCFKWFSLSKMTEKHSLNSHCVCISLQPYLPFEVELIVSAPSQITLPRRGSLSLQPLSISIPAESNFCCWSSIT